MILGSLARNAIKSARYIIARLYSKVLQVLGVCPSLLELGHSEGYIKCRSLERDVECLRGFPANFLCA